MWEELQQSWQTEQFPSLRVQTQARQIRVKDVIVHIRNEEERKCSNYRTPYTVPARV